MIPKFDIHHMDLHSSYISFDRYKMFLQNQAFNGYIKLDDSHTQCFFFIRDGKDISSFWIMRGSKFNECNPSEIPSVLKKPFFISSYRVPQQGVNFFARCYSAKVIYDNIAFDSIDFNKFFSQIEAKKITGIVEALRSDEPKRYIYFLGGKIFGYMNMKGKDDIFEKNLDKAHIQTALKNSTIKVYALSSQKHQSPSNSSFVNNSISSSQNSSENENRIAVLKCYEEIFQMLEKNTESAEFASIWRTSALELSNKYLFLNPFAGEFNYENSKIDLWEEIDTTTAVHAMDELINSIAKKANLPKDGIKAIKDNYLTLLATYEIRN